MSDDEMPALWHLPQSLWSWIPALFLLAALAMAAACVSPGSQPGVTPAPPTAGSSCGFTTCHGPDPACGTAPPEVCTMEYRLGDKCRQFARCEVSGSGDCRLVTDPGFDACRSCVWDCEARYGDDPAAAFTCEEYC